MVPFPYSLPGIGAGIAVTGLGANLFNTTTDAYAILIMGDAEGTQFGLEDFPIISKTLMFQASYQSIGKAVVDYYDTRGMDSDPDSLSLLELSKVDAIGFELCLCLFDRRLSIAVGYMNQKIQLDRIRDSEGTIIQDFVEPYHAETESKYLRLLVDYTDDFNDPRKGVRVGVTQSVSPQDDPDLPDYSVLDYSVGFYIPFGRFSTLVLNYFRSDANVSRTGVIDMDQIGQDLFGCNYAVCQQFQQEIIDNFINENTNGASTALGGQNRLRSYGSGRFQGAHTLFYAAEFRWNLTEESTPFNYLIWKDVRTAKQVAFFYERGTVAETKAELGDIYRETYGVGFRLVSASGFVYRGDLAWGTEGFEPVLIFGYPW